MEANIAPDFYVSYVIVPRTPEPRQENLIFLRGWLSQKLAFELAACRERINRGSGNRRSGAVCFAAALSF